MEKLLIADLLHFEMERGEMKAVEFCLVEKIASEDISGTVYRERSNTAAEGAFCFKRLSNRVKSALLKTLYSVMGIHSERQQRKSPLGRESIAKVILDKELKTVIGE